jgi:predicted GNAT family acetyltransferase
MKRDKWRPILPARKGVTGEAVGKLVVRDNPARHRFEIDLGDSTAIAVYKLVPGKIVFIHTEVPAQHRGQGIGTALVQAALASARERGLKVVPICPFFAAFIKGHKKEQDLLDTSSRKRLGIDS